MMSMKRVAVGGRHNRVMQGNRPSRSGEHRLLAASIMGLVAALAVGLSDPAHAAKSGIEKNKAAQVPVGTVRADDGAEQLRRLDIMLMVTSLRCRRTADDFQADYGDFTQEHLGDLNEAARALQAGFVGRYGEQGATRALDKISVVMANQYGAGHPWLNCHELKQITRGLARSHGRAALADAAAEVLADRRPRTVLALALK
ncbi:S-adenosyl-L-homocysteine hydrolase [Novosphingobium sp. BL-8H]|uniref:S-adenosyl-L-homocysteine hydrolase n=1 Tax=Novosphingobium sp. BL-8H TaxID=3127640 RepID=UPI0037565F28